MIEKIFPVFCGEFNAKKKIFEDFFSTGGLPAAPSVAVESVERGTYGYVAYKTIIYNRGFQGLSL